MNEQDMYKQLAKYYDRIYHRKDYEAEVKQLINIISKYKKSAGNDLLDTACGTGAHLIYLNEEYNCTGLDINKEMIEVCKEKGIEAEFVVGDMSKLNLEKQFDIITCLFSSIGYILTKVGLRDTIKGFARHLKAGGILLIEPWLRKEIYRVGTPHMITYDGEDVKIARLNISELDGDISYFEMHYLIAEHNKPIMHIVDKHKLAMFPIDFLLELMKEEGLDARILYEGLFESRGLLIGVKNK